MRTTNRQQERGIRKNGEAEMLHLFCAFLMLAALALPANAATIALDYALGFNGYFRLGTWAPLTVTLENRGRPIRGTLDVIVTSGSEFFQTVHQTVYTADLELPYNATKRARFTIHLSSFTHDLRIHLRDGDRMLADTTVSLRDAYTEKPLMVVVDDRITPDFLSVLPDDHFAVNALPRFLPETVFGYDGVALMIVNAAVLGDVGERQFQALREWLQQGGMLITSGSMNYGVFQEPRWQQVLPLRITGHREVSELSAFQRVCGQPLIGRQPFLLLEAELAGGEVLLEDGGVPVLTSRPAGRGRLVFLALDLQQPPFSRWEGRRAFWDYVGRLRPPRQQQVIELAKDTMLDALLRSMPAEFPHHWLAFGFLGLYLALMKLVISAFHRRKSNGARVLAAAYSVALVFSAAAYGLFIHPARRQKLAYDSLLHVHAFGNAPTAYGEFTMGMYGLKDTAYSVGFGDTVYPVRPVLPQNLYAAAPAPYVLDHTDGGQRIRGELEKWSYTFFRIDTPVDFTIQGEARRTPQNGLDMRFTSHSPAALRSVVGYFAGRLFPLGEIAAERDDLKTVSMAEIQEQDPFTNAAVRRLLPQFADNERPPFWQRMQREIWLEALTRTHEAYAGREDVIVLLGWMSSTVFEPRFHQSGSLGASATLVTWVLPIH